MAAQEVWTDALASDIAKMSEHLEQMEPAWVAAGEAMREHVMQRFQTSTGPDGEPWAPLSPKYAEHIGGGIWAAPQQDPNAPRRRRDRGDGRDDAGRFIRRRKGPPREGRKPGRILIQKGGSGGLLGSIYVTAENDGVTIGAGIVYARVHQFGDELEGIPARPYLPFLPDGSAAFPEGTPAGELFTEIEETIMDWLDILNERAQAAAAARGA